MNRMTKVFLIFCLLSIALFACNSKNANTKEENASSGTDESITLKLAGMSNEEHPSNIALNELADSIEDKTEGRVKIKIYPSNQLGDWTTVYDEIMKGTIDMGLITQPTEHNPKLEIASFPFIAKNYDSIEEIFGEDSYIYNTLDELNNEVDVKFLGFFAEEFGGIGSVEEIQDITDVNSKKKLLVRTPSFDIHEETMSSLGFQTSNVPFEDLYTSLQTGVVDAWIGGGATYNYDSFRDVIKYYYQLNTHFIATPLFMNKSTFEDIEEEDRNIIEEEAQEMMNKSFNQAEENEEEDRENLKSEGIEVVELDEDELEEIQNYIQEEIWPKFANRIGEENLNNLMDELDSIE